MTKDDVPFGYRQALFGAPKPKGEPMPDSTIRIDRGERAALHQLA